MLIATIALAILAQQPADASKPELAVISARLGSCAADFTVTDADGKPVYAATIHVRIRYGFLGLKRMDLEVGTNSDGKARVEGLPTGTRPLVRRLERGQEDHGRAEPHDELSDNVSGAAQMKGVPR